MGAGPLAAAAAVEETAFAGAEEEGKPGFGSGSVRSFSVSSPPDSGEEIEDTVAEGGDTSPVP